MDLDYFSEDEDAGISPETKEDLMKNKLAEEKVRRDPKKRRNKPPKKIKKIKDQNLESKPI